MSNRAQGEFDVTLKGLSGELAIEIANGQHFYDFTYTLQEAE